MVCYEKNAYSEIVYFSGIFSVFAAAGYFMQNGGQQCKADIGIVGK